jgi:uncharacterized protein
LDQGTSAGTATIFRGETAVSEKAIGIISDTHGLFDLKLLTVFRAVDHILHAGDIGKLQVLRQLEALAPVTAVYGNIDEGNVPSGLERERTMDLYGIRIFMLHILGDPQRLDLPVSQKIERLQPHVVVFGHSHKPLLQKQGTILYFNPGSAGPKRFSLPRSVGLLRLQDGQCSGEIVLL